MIQKSSTRSLKMSNKESKANSNNLSSEVKNPSKDHILRPDDNNFPIVGIGSSAGGSEALEIFLKQVPKQSGMSFIIVQHLDPTYKGFMAELLQRVTTMKVIEIRDGMEIEPNHVYVIPPMKGGNDENHALPYIG